MVFIKILPLLLTIVTLVEARHVGSGASRQRRQYTHDHSGSRNSTHTSTHHSGHSLVHHTIETLNVQDTKRMCPEILQTNCTAHVAGWDEKVCGSDGVTYENHCTFTQSICVYDSNSRTLTVEHFGACVTTTVAPPMTPEPRTTIKPTTKMTSSSTQTSHAPSTTSTPAPPPTTTVPTTTQDPFTVQFCKDAATLSCPDKLDVLCGSDGQFYPNTCELLKQKCTLATLESVDMSVCVAGGK